MITLEKAKRTDLASFVEMEQAEDTRAFILPSSLSIHEAQFRETDIEYLSIYHRRSLVGFVILAYKVPNEAELRRIVVSRKGQGIGQAAIRAVEILCREQLKIQRIWLDVFQANQRGRYIYEKMGYTPFKSSPSPKGTLLFLEKLWKTSSDMIIGD